MNMVFGKPWDAPVCDWATPVDTPTGVDCLRCAEPILDGEQGFVQPFMGDVEDRYIISADEDYALIAFHRECEMAGMVGHMVGVCSCTGWDSHSRAAAREVLRRVEAGGLRQ